MVNAYVIYFSVVNEGLYQNQYILKLFKKVTNMYIIAVLEIKSLSGR